MKRYLLAVVFLAGTVLVHAGFKLPRHVYEMVDVKKAAEEAKEKNRALAFVLTNKLTN